MTEIYFGDSWDDRPLTGEMSGPERFDDDVKASGITVAPDEVLVIVFPTFVGPQELAAHRERFREVLGSRFVLVSGDNIQLAKIKEEEWVRGTH